MKNWYLKLSTAVLFLVSVGVPVTAARGNAASNPSNTQNSAGEKSRSPQLLESAVLVLVGAGLLAGAIVVRKVVPIQQ